MTSGQHPRDGGPAAHTYHTRLHADTQSSPHSGNPPPRHGVRAASWSPLHFAPSPSLPWSLSPAGGLQWRKGQFGHSRAALEQTRWCSLSLLNQFLQLQNLNFLAHPCPYSFQRLVQLMRDSRKQQGMTLQFKQSVAVASSCFSGLLCSYLEWSL